jgi:hypothetical protein
MKYFLYSLSIILMMLIFTSFKLKRTLFKPNPQYPFNIEGIYYTNQVLTNQDAPRVLFFYENGLEGRRTIKSDSLSREFDKSYYEQNYVTTYPKHFSFLCFEWRIFEQVNDKIITTIRILDGPFHHGIYRDTLTILNDTTLMKLCEEGEVIYKMLQYPKPDSTIFNPCNKFIKSNIKIKSK